jgi:hypothetical protein
MLLKLFLKTVEIKLNMNQFYNRQLLLTIVKRFMVKGFSEIQLQFPNGQAEKGSVIFLNFV